MQTPQGRFPRTRMLVFLAMPSFDWTAYEEALTRSVGDAVAAIAKSRPSEQFYALAIRAEVPVRVALNSEDALEGLDRSFDSPRFDPAAFRWPELELVDAELRSLEEQLAKEKKPNRTKRQRALVNAAKRLRRELRERTPVTRDFIVYVFEPSQGLSLVKKCVEKKLFEKLFPEADPLYVERKRLDALPPAQRVDALIAALGAPDGIGWEEALDRMVAMGSDAVPHLTKALDSGGKERWQIACALGRIGPTRARDAILALRRFVDDESLGNNWCAMALGHLGDGEFLVERARAGVDVALCGLSASFLAFADEAARDSKERIPIEYELLGAFLDEADDEQKKTIQTDLEPGRSYRWEVHPLDVEPAVAALGSRHAVLRWHAASILGNAKLKKQEARAVADALVLALRDRNKLVRRLAMLSLQDHARHLQGSHWQAMAELAGDSDPVTMRIATEAAKRLQKQG